MKDEPEPPEPNMGYTDLELMPAVVVGSFVAGSRYFCESLFWASQPKQAAKT